MWSGKRLSHPLFCVLACMSQEGFACRSFDVLWVMHFECFQSRLWILMLCYSWLSWVLLLVMSWYSFASV
jgi:hypothetical protein